MDELRRHLVHCLKREWSLLLLYSLERLITATIPKEILMTLWASIYLARLVDVRWCMTCCCVLPAAIVAFSLNFKRQTTRAVCTPVQTIPTVSTASDSLRSDEDQMFRTLCLQVAVSCRVEVLLIDQSRGYKRDIHVIHTVSETRTSIEPASTCVLAQGGFY